MFGSDGFIWIQISRCVLRSDSFGLIWIQTDSEWNQMKTVTHKRFHLCWQIPMNWKWRESVYCDWRRWHRWPHQEISPPWSPYRHQDPPIATILTPRDEPPAGREPPPRGFYRLGQVSPKNDNFSLESTLCCSHPCWLFLRQMRGRERRERQTKCSAVWGRHNVELCRTQFFMVLEF